MPSIGKVEFSGDGIAYAAWLWVTADQLEVHIRRFWILRTVPVLLYPPPIFARGSRVHVVLLLFKFTIVRK